MEIINILTLLMLFILITITKKSENKLNIILQTIINIVIILVYNIFICYTLNIIKIPINLISLSIINIIASISLGMKIYKDKGIQKYFIDKKDIVFVLLITIIIGIVAYKNFGFPFNIKYETSDPYIHARAAILFSEEQTLLNNIDDGIIKFNNFMPGAYINCGLIMKVCNNIIDPIDKYQIFIGFSIFMFYMTALSMYALCTSDNKTTKLISFICTLLFALGYPLNSMLFGFEYLSMLILVAVATLYIVKNYKQYNINKYLIIIEMFLLNLAIFMSYYLFVPLMYGIEIVVFLANKKTDKQKLITKNNLIILFITVILPSIMGLIYLILPQFINTPNNTVVDVAKLDGTIYRNYFSNIMLQIPFIFFIMYKEAKEKNKLSNMTIATLITIIFTMLAFLAMKATTIISSYYIAKIYYVLWIFTIYMLNESLIYISNKSQIKSAITLGIYLILITISFITNKDIKINFEKIKSQENLTTISQIYNVNLDIIKNSQIDYSYDEIQLLKIAREKMEFNEKTEIIGRFEHIYWTYSITGFSNVDHIKKIYLKGYNKQQKEKWTQNPQNEYILFFKRSDIYEEYKDKIYNNRELILENEQGGILIKK